MRDIFDRDFCEKLSEIYYRFGRIVIVPIEAARAFVEHLNKQNALYDITIREDGLIEIKGLGSFEAKSQTYRGEEVEI